MAQFNLMDMLGGGVQRREAPTQDSSLGQLLGFLSQSQQQAPQMQQQGSGPVDTSLIHLLMQEHEKQKLVDRHQEAVDYMKNLVGTPGSDRVPTPMLGAQDATPGTGMLGGKMTPKEFYLNAASSPDENTSLAALREFGNLNTTHGGRGGRSLHTGGVEGSPDQSQLGYINEDDKWVPVSPPRKDTAGLPTGWYRNPDNTLSQYTDPTGTNILDVKKNISQEVKASPAYRAEDSYQLDERRVRDAESENSYKKVLEMPEAQKNAWIGNKASVDRINEALRQATDHPEHFGLQNLLGDKVNQYIDKEGQEARSKVAEIGSTKRHDVSGAAVTASESPVLRPFIPEVSDRPSAIIQKLNSMREKIVGVNSEIEKTYTNGFRRQPWAQQPEDTTSGDVKVSSGSLPLNPSYGQEHTAPDGSKLKYRGKVDGNPIWSPPYQGELKQDSPPSPSAGDIRINPTTGKKQRWVP
jgi:hypothetical protein